MPSVLWRCWLGSRKGIRPVKNWVLGCWHGYLSGARCRLAYGPADATATHCLLLQKNQIGFTFLVPAHLGSPDKGALSRCILSFLFIDAFHVTFDKISSIRSIIGTFSNRRCAIPYFSRDIQVILHFPWHPSPIELPDLPSFPWPAETPHKIRDFCQRRQIFCRIFLDSFYLLTC